MHPRVLILPAILVLTVCGCSGETDAGGPGPSNGADAARTEDSESFFSDLLDFGPEEVTAPAGTPLKLTLESGISSESNRAGDEFLASFREPLIVEGKLAVPEGARARGRVTEARRSGRVEGRARVQMELTEILYEDDAVSIETRPFIVEAEGTTGRDAAAVAGAGGVGAAIGAIAGGGKGAAIGAAAGAAAGTGGVLLTRGAEVELVPETRIDFELAEAVELPVSDR